MFWIVTCFTYPRVFTKEGSCGECSLSCICIKYFGPKAPQSFNPALWMVERNTVQTLYTCISLLHGSAPCYLQQTVRSVASMESRRRLQSVSSSDLIVPATRRSTLGDRAFAVAGPRAWNNLPDASRHCPSLATFKCSLKTFLQFFAWFSSTNL